MATQTGSIDLKAAKKAHDDAEKVATNYVADISNGILVHPDNDTTNGVKITNVVEVIRGSASVAEFGTSARIGENANGKSRTEIGNNGMQIIQRDSGSDVPIAHLGYGQTFDGSGTAVDAPYYTLGTRLGTIGSYSVTEGKSSAATGDCSHAEGCESEAHSDYAHAGGYQSWADGVASFAHGQGVTAGSRSQTVLGEYNIIDSALVYNRGVYAFIVGNGASDNVRSNALAVDWGGDVFLAVNTSSPPGTTDGDLYAAIVALGWASDVIV